MQDFIEGALQKGTKHEIRNKKTVEPRILLKFKVKKKNRGLTRRSYTCARMRAAVEGSVLILATWGSLKCAESRHGRFRFSPLLEKQPPRPRSNLCYNCKMDYCHGEGIHALKVYLFGALQLQHKSIGSDLMIGRDLELVADEKFPAGDGGHPLLYCVRQ